MRSNGIERPLLALQQKGNEILKEDGFLTNGKFYEKLKDYNSLYFETRMFLLDKCYEDEPIKQKLKTLPILKYIDFSNKITFENIMMAFGYVVLFPIGIAYLLKKKNYVSSTKEQIQDISSSCTELSSMIRSAGY